MLVGGPAGTALGLLIVSAWEALAAGVCFFAARGVLHDCDIQVIKAVL
jgi:hypothetical protein